jgi:hypothetical protein
MYEFVHVPFWMYSVRKEDGSDYPRSTDSTPYSSINAVW